MEKKILDIRVVAIGKQNFEDMISHNNFYIDKTRFIKEWWENDDSVTLITRPRRFGKTLLMSTVEQFFSIEYKEKSWLFEGLDIFREEKYKKLQGTYPVIFLSFASVKETTYKKFYRSMEYVISSLYKKYFFYLILISFKIGKKNHFLKFVKENQKKFKFKILYVHFLIIYYVTMEKKH